MTVIGPRSELDALHPPDRQAAIATLQMAHAIGVDEAHVLAGGQPDRPVEDRRRQVRLTSTGSSPATIGTRNRTPRPIATIAGWPGTTVAGRQADRAKNAMAATIPTRTSGDGRHRTGSYSATTTPVAIEERDDAAATGRIAVDETHFEIQIAPRETGFDATQARVPVSRSWTMRLTTAKIAATTKICDETAASRLSPDRATASGSAGHAPAPGRLARSRC